jgi:hypothetical protein
MEPAVNPAILPDESGQLAGRPLEEWNGAYAKVESYFHALRIRNKPLLGQLVLRVLERAQRRAPAEPNISATQLAAEEMDRIVTEWFSEVLQTSPTNNDQTLSTRGRLALLLADMPGRWQDQFLRPGPWPEEFTGAMRETYFRAGPDFQLSKMTPRPLDLGPITTLTNIGRLPYFKMALVWTLFALLLVAVFWLTHGGFGPGPGPPAAADRLVPAKCLTPRTFPWRRPRASSAAGACSFFIPARCCSPASSPCCSRTCSGAPAGPRPARPAGAVRDPVFVHRHRLHAWRVRIFLRMFGDRRRITGLKDYRGQTLTAPARPSSFPIYNEDVMRVYEGLRATYESSQKTGQLERFDFFILSDSTDPDKWVEEERRWYDLVRDLDALGKIYYRRRLVNEARKKSGNMRDFLNTWGRRYRYFICSTPTA